MEPGQVQVVVTDGAVGEEVKERARQKVAALEQYAPRDFLYAQVQFAQRPNEAQAAIVHGLLDVQGTIVQARLRADEPDECLDLVTQRLQGNLRRLTERLQSRRQEPAAVSEGEWRHGALPTARPDHFPRPPDDRELVERITHARAPSTPEEAAFDLEMLEDDWLLYVDDETGADAVIRRHPDSGAYGLSVAGESAPSVTDQHAVQVEAEAPPPDLSTGDAVERLRSGDEDHVFFVDTATGRGAVVYWRYDGHYGLVRPRET